MRTPETRNAKLSCLNIQVSTTLASPRPPLEPLSIRRFPPTARRQFFLNDSTSQRCYPRKNEFSIWREE